MLKKLLKQVVYSCNSIACKICGQPHRKCTSKNGVCPSCVEKGHS